MNNFWGPIRFGRANEPRLFRNFGGNEPNFITLNACRQVPLAWFELVRPTLTVQFMIGPIPLKWTLMRMNQVLIRLIKLV